MPLPDDDPQGLLAEQKSGDNAPALSVSELSGALKRTVESAFGFVRVRGEISGWKRHASGHCYFTLKDEAACIDAVIWKGQAGALAFRPEDGAEVIASGRLTTYPGRSKYQIVVSRMELAGEGALMALLDKRRRALAAEGLFDEAKKRRLPFLPRVIGVVTSPTGAVIRDILHRLEDRCPTHVIVWPVPVQGEGAAGKVAAAIRGFATLERRPDLLIVARGGGSIEDLWAFNEEVVARAIVAVVADPDRLDAVLAHGLDPHGVLVDVDHVAALGQAPELTEDEPADRVEGLRVHRQIEPIVGQIRDRHVTAHPPVSVREPPDTGDAESVSSAISPTTSATNCAELLPSVWPEIVRISSNVCGGPGGSICHHSRISTAPPKEATTRRTESAVPLRR